MYDNEGQLLSSYELLGELAEQWDTLDTNTKNYIASTIAGTHQLNNFLALMNNFDHAIEATETALNSAGSAATENSRYMESLNAKTNQLKATFQDLANNVIDSQLVKSILDLANGFLKLVNTPVGNFITQVTLLTTAGWGLVQLFQSMNIVGVVVDNFKRLSDAYKAIKYSIQGVITVSDAFNTALSASLPIIGAVALAVTALVKISDAISQELFPSVEDLNNELSDLNSKLNDLIDKRKELESIDIRTDLEERKLELLNLQIEAQEKLIEQQERSIALTQFGTGALEQSMMKGIRGLPEMLDALISGDYTGLQKLESSLEDIGKDFEELEYLREQMNELDPSSGAYEAYLTRYLKLTDDITASVGENAEIIEELQIAVEKEYITQEQANAALELWNEVNSQSAQLGLATVASYQESANKLAEYNQRIKDGAVLTATEREEMNQLAEAVKNGTDKVKEAIDANGSLGSEYNAVNESMASVYNEYAELNQVQDLNLDKCRLTRVDYEKLARTFPEVEESMSMMNGEYYVGIEAMSKFASAGDQMAMDYLEQQVEMTKTAYEQAQQRIGIQIEEAKTMTRLWNARSREAGLSPEDVLLYSNTALEYSKAANELQVELEQFRSNYASARRNLERAQTGFWETLDSDSGTSSSTSKTVDLIEEQNKIFEEQNRIIENTIALKKEQGANEEELIELNKKYQDQLHEQADWFRANSEEETSEYIMDRRKMYAELDNENKEYYQSILQRGRDAWDEQLDIIEDNINWQKQLGEWAAQDYVNAWAEALSILESLYAQDVVDFEYYQEQKKDLNRELTLAQKEAQEEAERLAEEARQAEIDAIQEQIDSYETAFNYMVGKIDEEIAKLEEERDVVEKYWDDKIQALEDQNDELERQIELEEALDNLARARQTKVMVYKDGRFQYISDIDQVSEAQANLEKLEREEALRQEVENLETLKDQALASIDEQIKGWEKYKEEWSSVVEHYQEEQDKLIAEQVLGIELEGDNWQTRLDNLSGYVSQYEALMARLAQAQASANAMIQQGITGSTAIGSWGSGGGSGSISSLAPNWGGSSGLTNWVGGTIQGENGSIMDGKVAVIKSGLGGGAAPVYYNPTTGKVTSSGLGYGDIVLTQGGAYMITGGTAGNYTSVPYTGGSSSSSSGGGSGGGVWDDDGNWVGTGNTGTATDWENRYEGDDWSDLWWEAENDPTLSEEERDDLQDYFHDKKEEEMSGSGATFNPDSGKWEYATGTLSAHGGLSLVGEKGPELRVLGQGDGIIPNDITKNLWSWGTTSPNSFMGGIAEVLRSIGEQTGIIIQNFSPNLPNITDGEGFVTYMKNNFWREAVQFSKT